MKKYLFLTFVTMLVLVILTQCVAQTPTISYMDQTPKESSTSQAWKVGMYRISRTKEIDDLMAPIDQDIREYFRSFDSPDQIIQADTTQLATILVRKYHDNLNTIIQIFEKETGQHLSQKDRELLMRIIVEDEIERILDEEMKSMLGTPEIEFEATVVPVSPPVNQP